MIPVMKSDLNVINNGHILEKPYVLECSCYTIPVYLRSFVSGDIIAVKFYETFIRAIYARKKIEDCSLAGSIRSNKTIELSFFYFQIEIVNGSENAERNTENRNLKECHINLLPSISSNFVQASDFFP